MPNTVNVANVQSTTLRVNGIEIDPSGAVSDQVLKFNGTKFVPAADVSGAGGGVSYEETIGNNTDTTFTVTHSLNTKNIDVIVRDNVSPYEVIDVRWEATTNDTITLDFSAAPPNNSRRVEIKGPGTQDYYSATIGNGSSSTINLDHNLGTKSVVTVVRNASSPYEVVEVQASAPTINRVTLDFSTAPTANSLVASVYSLFTDYAYESIIGDGSTTEFTITHNLNTRDIGVISRNTVSPYDFTVVKWEATTVNTAKIIFTAAPSTNSRKITVFNSFGGFKSFNPEFGLIDGDIIPNQDNVYTLGNTALRWKSISIGGGTIYITDSGNNNQVALTVNNGVFNINGIAQAQLPNVTITNLTFSDSTVQTTAAPKYYGSFYDTTTQTATNASVAYSMQLSNTAPETNGISITSGSRITFAYAGTYNIQFSAQLDKTDSSDDLVNIWFAKNGTPIADSNTQVTVLGNGGKYLASWNFIVSVTAGQYMEIKWQSPDTNMRLVGSAAQTSPTRPATPSVIVTAVQIA